MCTVRPKVRSQYALVSSQHMELLWTLAAGGQPSGVVAGGQPSGGPHAVPPCTAGNPVFLAAEGLEDFKEVEL